MEGVIDDKDRSSHRPIGGSYNDKDSNEILVEALARLRREFGKTSAVTPVVVPASRRQWDDN